MHYFFCAFHFCQISVRTADVGDRKNSAHQKFWELNRVPLGVCLLLRLLRPDRKGLFYTDTIYSLTAFLLSQVPTEILGDQVAWEVAYNFSVSEAPISSGA